LARRLRHEASPTGRAVIPDAVDLDPDAFVTMPDGRRMQRHTFGLRADDMERIRSGYVCLKCLEDYDTAFPDECMVCHFPMRERQLEEFTKDFRGDVAYGPTTTVDEEYEIAEETIAREAYDRATRLGLILPNPSIIVPS
jgi:hypothetical protein